RGLRGDRADDENKGEIKPTTLADRYGLMNSIGIRSCFVTGAGGVVGRAVCRQLAEQGARVVAHDLPGRLEDGPAGAVEPVCGDVLDWPHLSAAVRGAGCEYVVHLAALVAS